VEQTNRANGSSSCRELRGSLRATLHIHIGAINAFDSTNAGPDALHYEDPSTLPQSFSFGKPSPCSKALSKWKMPR
jgi:hypothetical protein